MLPLGLSLLSLFFGATTSHGAIGDGKTLNTTRRDLHAVQLNVTERPVMQADKTAEIKMR